MKQNRRDFIKSSAVAATAAAAGVAMPAGATNLITRSSETDIRWDKAPCRFCGTGCSVLVGVKNGRMVASQGDPDAPVNKGLNCHQGLFPAQDHVRLRSPDNTAAAYDRWQV